MSATKDYARWAVMIHRCSNPDSQGYAKYGGRGITVCERWHIFENFFADMGPRPSPDHSLDRIDNNGPYSPENCRWATRKQQMNNTRDNRMLTFNGETLSVAQWAAKTNISHLTIRSRLNVGWPIERVLTEPVHR